MANRQGDVDLRLAQVSAPVNTLAWPQNHSLVGRYKKKTKQDNQYQEGNS